MLTLPPVPTPTITRLGTVWPATKLRLDASGMVTPVGHTVRKPAVLAFASVTFKTTADTPLDGTPPRPVTWRSIFWLGARMPAAMTPLPVLVSSSLDGTSGLKRPSGPGDEAGSV